MSMLAVLSMETYSLLHSSSRSKLHSTTCRAGLHMLRHQFGVQRLHLSQALEMAFLLDPPLVSLLYSFMSEPVHGMHSFARHLPAPSLALISTPGQT